MNDQPISRDVVGILVFDDVEVLDFAGPFEVFSVVRLDESRRTETESPFKVLTVSPSGQGVVARGGLRIGVDHGLEDCPRLDLLVVPGGWGTRKLVHDERLSKWLAARREETPRIASVCTGSLLLGRAGLLAGRQATTHWRSLGWLRDVATDASIVGDRHFLVEPDLASSAGISAGIDLALRLVAERFGEAVGRSTARNMEYPWPESDARRVPVEPLAGSPVGLRIERSIPSYERIAALYAAAPLRRPVRDRERIETMFRNANVVRSAWDGIRLVGLLRAWTDFAFDGFVSDLAIHPEWQGKGLGKRLLDCLSEYGDGIQWTLHASPLAREYYPKVGWKTPAAPWILPRQGFDSRDPRDWQRDHLDLARLA